MLIVEALLHENLGLFTFSSGDNLSYQVNATPSPDQLAFRYALFGEDPLAAFSFVGRLLAKSIRDGQLINAHFTRPFYKMLLNRPYSFADLEASQPRPPNRWCLSFQLWGACGWRVWVGGGQGNVPFADLYPGQPHRGHHL